MFTKERIIYLYDIYDIYDMVGFNKFNRSSWTFLMYASYNIGSLIKL
jgi:hypothetical protein